MLLSPPPHPRREQLRWDVFPGWARALRARGGCCDVVGRFEWKMPPVAGGSRSGAAELPEVGRPSQFRAGGDSNVICVMLQNQAGCCKAAASGEDEFYYLFFFFLHF